MLQILDIKILGKKLYSLLLILTLIKKVNAFHKFMSVLITFVAINYEEM